MSRERLLGERLLGECLLGERLLGERLRLSAVSVSAVSLSSVSVSSVSFPAGLGKLYRRTHVFLRLSSSSSIDVAKSTPLL